MRTGANLVNMTHMSTDDDALARSREHVTALRASLEASEGHPVRLIETHISWVLLTDTLAYKLKKPVRLPFLDFTTLAARRHFCEEELRLNRRLAPSLYIDVVDVRESPEGARFGGVERVVDVALRMRRFPDGALWSEMLAAGTLAAQHIDAMAQRLNDFHRDVAAAPPGSVFGSAASHERATRRLIEGVEACLGEATSPGMDVEWLALRAWLDGQRQALAPLWEARRRDGRVRECHGDLHLANVLQLGGEVTAFDGIEFDDELRWIDVLDDISFLAMDLLAHGQRALAFRFVNAYLAVSGDYDGIPRYASTWSVARSCAPRSRPSANGRGCSRWLAATRWTTWRLHRPYPAAPMAGWRSRTACLARARATSRSGCSRRWGRSACAPTLSASG